jgi:hypothetical protein
VTVNFFFVRFGFPHQLNVIRGSVLTSSGFSLFPIAFTGIEPWSSHQVHHQSPLNQLTICVKTVKLKSNVLNSKSHLWLLLAIQSSGSIKSSNRIPSKHSLDISSKLRSEWGYAHFPPQFLGTTRKGIPSIIDDLPCSIIRKKKFNFFFNLLNHFYR